MSAASVAASRTEATQACDVVVELDQALALAEEWEALTDAVDAGPRDA